MFLYNFAQWRPLSCNNSDVMAVGLIPPPPQYQSAPRSSIPIGLKRIHPYLLYRTHNFQPDRLRAERMFPFFISFIRITGFTLWLLDSCRTSVILCFIWVNETPGYLEGVPDLRHPALKVRHSSTWHSGTPALMINSWFFFLFYVYFSTNFFYFRIRICSVP